MLLWDCSSFKGAAAFDEGAEDYGQLASRAAAGYLSDGTLKSTSLSQMMNISNWDENPPSKFGEANVCEWNLEIL
jgi:hypothetical protein